MKLTHEEEALRGGEFGEAAQWGDRASDHGWAISGARDFIAVSLAHIAIGGERTLRVSSWLVDV